MVAASCIELRSRRQRTQNTGSVVVLAHRTTTGDLMAHETGPPGESSASAAILLDGGLLAQSARGSVGDE